MPDQHTNSPTPSSSSTLIVPPFPLLDNAHCGIHTKKRPDLKLDIYTSDNLMSGKGFIEPHRNNLPRRKRRVVTAPLVDPATATSEMGKTLSLSHTLLQKSEAGPRSSIEEYPLYDDSGTTGTHGATPGLATTPIPPIQSQSSPSSSSSSADTNITEPPSSLHASPKRSSTPPNKPSTSFLTNPNLQQTPRRAVFHNHPVDDASSVVVTPPPLPITPTKGHLQPTSATLPRRHRSLVSSAAREKEREQRRRSIADRVTADSRKHNDARKEVVGSQRVEQTKTGTDNLVADVEIQSMRRMQSVCRQELAKGIMLGFLIDRDDQDENVVRIEIYDDSTTPLSSFIPSSQPSSSPPLPTASSSSLSSPELQLQLSLPTHPLSYKDGTTSLTDSQIQQACTFIDDHISISEPSNNNTRSGHMSALILSPRARPEEAMSIGVSYLAGMERIDIGAKTEGVEERDGHYHDHTYSAVHRLVMAFHDDPGSPIVHHGTQPQVDNNQPDTLEQPNSIMFSHSNLTLARRGMDKGSWRGLRPEWRGVLSFDGIQQLDSVWTSTKRS